MTPPRVCSLIASVSNKLFAVGSACLCIISGGAPL